jgi:pimeloyl-ACP methyl ester carboxylesterase
MGKKNERQADVYFSLKTSYLSRDTPCYGTFPWLIRIILMSIHAVNKLIVKEHEFHMPLDYSSLSPLGKDATISVFARELLLENTATSADVIVYFQGGPGFECPRLHQLGEWLHVLLKSGYRVLLLDQRGTGLSTAITDRTIKGMSVEKQLHYLSCFRADSIVRDAEIIRENLIGDQAWIVLGQSYGGFCAVCYLAMYPASLKAVLITGGLPPFVTEVGDVYRDLFRRVISMNERYYERFPEDVKRMKDIANYLTERNVLTPNGGRLTVQKFLQLGLLLGLQDGFEELHCLAQEAFEVFDNRKELSYRFLHAIETRLPFDTHPLYAVLHEPIYCCTGMASNWAAYRALSELPGDCRALFSHEHPTCVYFTGEMIFPWMFDDYIHLREFKRVAEALARHDTWTDLYDYERLKQNRVPCAAIIYEDDMYVSTEYSLRSAASIGNLLIHRTDSYMHSGLRDAGGQILQLLSGLIEPALNRCLVKSPLLVLSEKKSSDQRDLWIQDSV